MTQVPRFCRHCGAALQPGVRFCESCGRQLVDPPQDSPPAARGGPVPPGSPALPQSPDAARSPVLWIAVGVLAGVLIVGAGVALLRFREQAPTSLPASAAAASAGQVLGEGSIANADFKFSFVRHDDGSREGSLVHHVKPNGPRFEAMRVNSVAMSGQAASVWGVATQAGSAEMFPFNLSILPGFYRLEMHKSDGSPFRIDRGLLVSGSVTVKSQ